MTNEGARFRKADNSRVNGWDQMRQRFVGIDDEPMIYVFNTCVDSIRTIPLLQHDENRPEDLDSDMEDHAADDWRYACMSRPMLRTVKKRDKAPEVGTIEWVYARTKETKEKSKYRL
jgi:hypothetical protein